MTVAVVANTKKEGTRSILPAFLTALADEGIDAVLHEELSGLLGGSFDYRPVETLFNGADMIVSFGGDGTFLYAARLSARKGIPILGINLGKLGFLAELSPDEIAAVPKKLANGEFEIIERMAFCATTTRDKTYFSLNDIVLDRNIDTRILRLTVSIDGLHAGEFHADGLIVSTPTGSTAHSMSAGGPLVIPDCSVTILTPICPHSLTMRPMIVDGASVVVIGVVEGSARMAVDGQSFVDVPAGCEVTIRKADEPVRIARFGDKTYFDILHTRLRWGVSLKLKNA